MLNLSIDGGAFVLLSRLRRFGFEAYIVGGCVRDLLCGRRPKDWDICTDARPEEVQSVFRDLHVIPTGLRHGTVTVRYAGQSYEITTFRIDGAYADHRRPAGVSFTSHLTEDLARRDFTINAMAYAPHTGLIDPFGGAQDLRKERLVCVGDPDQRFQEDALRILRALRFAAVFKMDIASSTEAALLRSAFLLCKISKERIRDELCKTLLGEYSLRVLLRYKSILSLLIPEFYLCIGFPQKNPYHIYNIYDHIAHATANYTGDDLIIKLALFLHDIGKPLCYTEDARGGHFHGHGVVSRDLAAVVLDRLRFDNATKNAVLELILYHDATIEPTPKVVRRWLSRIGEEQFFRLMEVRLADIRAHAFNNRLSRIRRCLQLRQLARRILSEKPCLTLRDLAISGRDILAAGIPQGPAVGSLLSRALSAVIAGEVPNDRGILLSYIF